MRSTAAGRWRDSMGWALVASLWAPWLGAGFGPVAPRFMATAQARPTVSPTALLELDHRTALGDGATQARADASPGQDGPRMAFQVARFRTGVRLVEGPLNVQLTGEVAGGRLVPLDAFALWHIDEAFRIEAGAVRGPLGALFHREPITTQPFSERAAVELAFRQRRDVGLGLNWEPVHLPLAANLRLGNGSGPAAWQPALYLLLEGRFGRAHRAHLEAPWGLWLGVSGLRESAEVRRSAAFATPFGAPVSLSAPVAGDRSVADAHAVAWVGPVRLRLEAAYALEARGQDQDPLGGTPTARAQASVRSAALTGEVNWVARGGARVIGRAPTRPATGPAIEVSARAERLWFDLEDTRWQQAVTSGSVGVKAWISDWWAVALVAFGQAGRAGVLTPLSSAAFRLVEEGGVYLRSSFFFGGDGGP